jgi:hypothetical protein
MSAIGMRILMIGKPSDSTTATLRRLGTRGWGARNVEKLAEARELMETYRFDLVLASESLADGSGYDIREFVTQQGGTLLVSVALSESCLWLPVVEWGVKVLGNRALNAAMLESEAEMLLSVQRNDKKETHGDASPLKDVNSSSSAESAARRKNALSIA